MTNPKDLMTVAALATLRADPDAVQRTEVALEALNEHRKAPRSPTHTLPAVRETIPERSEFRPCKTEGQL